MFYDHFEDIDRDHEGRDEWGLTTEDWEEQYEMMREEIASSEHAEDIEKYGDL